MEAGHGLQGRSVGIQGSPNSDLTHFYSRTTFWGQTGPRVHWQGAWGYLLGCRVLSRGCSELLGAGSSVGPQGKKPSASILNTWTTMRGGQFLGMLSKPRLSDDSHQLGGGGMAHLTEEGARLSPGSHGESRALTSPTLPSVPFPLPVNPHLPALAPCLLLHCLRPVGSAHVS